MIPLFNGLDNMGRPDWRQVRILLDSHSPTADELAPQLPGPSTYPYGRKVLHQNGLFEVVGMNWSIDQECAPHDHGNSSGLISITAGEVVHTAYRIDEGGTPQLHKKMHKRAGDILFAPRGFVHSMGNRKRERLITLHVYSPPITGMKVYDLRKCAACVVSNDCGAWWPASQRQVVREIILSRGNP